MSKAVVYIVEWEDMECGGFHSVHRTTEGAKKEAEAAKKKDRFGYYHVLAVELQN